MEFFLIILVLNYVGQKEKITIIKVIVIMMLQSQFSYAKKIIIYLAHVQNTMQAGISPYFTFNACTVTVF